MFGSYFLFTQYLQFVHGYNPLAGGDPHAAVGARLHGVGDAVGEAGRALRSAPGGELRAGDRRARVWPSWRRRAACTASYWWFALGIIVQALGMGITTAPSTGAIMRSLPLHKAGVGSAVNDTTRELGGALGVAVLGSLVASHFRSSFGGAVSGLPEKATHSLAEALQHAAAVGGARGGVIADAARVSFVDAFSSTLWVAMVVVVVASGLVAWLLRPAATEAIDADDGRPTCRSRSRWRDARRRRARVSRARRDRPRRGAPGPRRSGAAADRAHRSTRPTARSRATRSDCR